MVLTLQRTVVDEVVGEVFYDVKLPAALRNAQSRAGKDGFVASLPQLVDARLLADGNSEIWQNWYTANSEENVGKIKFGSPVLVVVHGGGIWSDPKRIEKAYKDGLNNVYAGKIGSKEFSSLVDGRLPNGSGIDVLSFKEFDEAKELPSRYAVVLDFNKIKALPSGVQKGKVLRDNELFIARAGGRSRANAYLDKTAQVYGTDQLGNWHPFASVNPDEEQGRLLFVGDDFNIGFSGNSLNNNGRFVAGVSAGGAQKEVSRSDAREKSVVTPSLEQILSLGRERVPSALWKEFEVEAKKLYKN